MGKPSKARSCENKIPYPTRKAAQAAAKTAARRIGDTRLKIYHCSYVDHWHNGHRMASRSKRRRR